MKLISVELEGFGSFTERTKISFDSNLIYVLGRNYDRPDHANSNGSGKTTVLDAISWALFGECPSGRSKDDVINHGAKSAIVTLLTSTTCVERSKSRGHGEKIRWHDGDGDWRSGDYDRTQAELLESLGISFKTFCNTLYLTRDSKTVRFLDATPGDRAKVLSDLIDQTPYLVAADRVQRDIEESERMVRESSTTVSVLTREVESSRVHLSKLKEEFANYTEHENVRRAEVNKQLLQLDREAHALKKRMSEAPEYTFKELETEKIGLNKLFVELLDLKGRLQGAQEFQLEPEPGTSCPMCKREMSEQDCINLAELSLSQAEELEYCVGQIANTQHALQIIARKEEEVRQHRQQTQLDEGKLKAIAVQAKLLKDSLASTDTRHLESMIREREVQIVDYNDRIRQAEEEISERAKELPILKELKRGFQSDVRNILFDGIRTSLEYYTSRYLYLLAGDEFSISFPQQASTGSEKFTVLLRSGNEAQDLSCYSEGETWRATFACLLGFRRTLLDSTGRKFDFLLVDDPVGALDDRGTETFNELLGLLASEGEIGTTIATIPRESALPSNSTRLTVARKGRISYIEEDE